MASPLGDGTDTTYDRIEYKYNRLGARKEMKDQNGTVHASEFDDLGRPIHDRVTNVGSGIDDAVLRLSRTYEVRGMLQTAASYDNATAGSGNVVNEVVREYNDLGMLDKEYQEHEGAKDGTTLYVGYNYDESNSSGEFTKGLRPTSVRYPNGRLVHYTYGSAASDADNLNRLDAIKDDNSGSPGDTLASYTYLGQGMIVIEDYEEPDVRLDYFGGTSGTYAGFDRFNRVVDQRWYDYGSSADVDRYKYGYDRASNRLWRENVVSKSLGSPVYLDEYYTYDGLNRLKNFDRGELNGGYTAITGTPSAEEDWSLDPLGNWSGYVQKTSGSTDLDQSRAVNKANEITNITETTGDSWASPGYDLAGNMTSVPKPVDLTASYDCTYDAWNRLVKVEDGAYTIGVYEYDTLRRRVKKHYDSAAPDNPAGVDTYAHHYYDEGHELLETRIATAESDQPESRQPYEQYVLSHRDDNAVLIRDRNSDNDGLCDDQRVFHLLDARRNTTALLESSGAIGERYGASPHGSTSVLNPDCTARPGSAYGNMMSFAGQNRDAETGSLYFPSGVLSAIGTWTTRSTLALQTRPNQMAFLSATSVGLDDAAFRTEQTPAQGASLHVATAGEFRDISRQCGSSQFCARYGFRQRFRLTSRHANGPLPPDQTGGGYGLNWRFLVWIQDVSTQITCVPCELPPTITSLSYTFSEWFSQVGSVTRRNRRGIRHTVSYGRDVHKLFANATTGPGFKRCNCACAFQVAISACLGIVIGIVPKNATWGTLSGGNAPWWLNDGTADSTTGVGVCLMPRHEWGFTVSCLLGQCRLTEKHGIA